MTCRWNLHAWRRQGQSALWPLQRRSRYSSQRTVEKINLHEQSEDDISLDIHHPQKTSSDKSISTPVLLYLPRGPYMHDERDEISNLDVLGSNLDCTIVRLNYRLSREQQYPTPIHDVLRGYDWVLENLLPKRAITRAGRSENVGKLAVCGELIGGALASMLALTECRAGEPGIVAAAVSNPLVDWVSFTEPVPSTANTKRRRSKPPSIAQNANLEALEAVRAQLFQRPDDYFDPFASPILFFRSAGIGVPKTPPAVPQNEMEHLSRLEREGFVPYEEAASAPSPSSSDFGDGVERPIQVSRKVSRRFPSKAFRLRLPSFYVSSTSTSPLREQTEEFTSLLRKSMVRQNLEFGRKVLLEEEDGDTEDASSGGNQDKVQAKLYEGGGLWDGSADGKERLTDMIKWLRTVIGE